MDVVFKLIVIGDPRVGKTSLLMKYAKGKFKSNYIPTIGVNVTKQLFSTELADVTLSIWDIAGQTHIYQMFKSYYEGANGIIIVYDVTRKITGDHVKDWYEECIKNGIAQVPVIIACNKIDLCDGENDNEKIKEFTEMIEAHYFETSAASGLNVTKMFFTAADSIARSKI